MTPAYVLKRARKLVKRGWTRGAWARDKQKQPVLYSARTAVCWCSSGAISRVCNQNDVAMYGAIDLLTRAARLRSSPIAVWNDRSTKSAVLAAFDKAIALAETTP